MRGRRLTTAGRRGAVAGVLGAGLAVTGGVAVTAASPDGEDGSHPRGTGRGAVEQLTVYGVLASHTAVTATGVVDPPPEEAEEAGMNIPGTRFINVFELYGDPGLTELVGRDHAVCTGMDLAYADGGDGPPISGVGLCHGSMTLGDRGSLAWLATQTTDFTQPPEPGALAVTGALLGGTGHYKTAGGQYDMYLEPSAEGEPLRFRLEIELVRLTPRG